MSIAPGSLGFAQLNSSPPTPPVGYCIIYSKTDNVLYLKDSSGTEVALGSASAITSLVGEATGAGPGVASVTLDNTAVINKVLTGFLPGPNSTVLATDSLIIAIQKLQAQVSSSIGTAITSLTGDVSAVGPGAASSTINSVGGSSASNIHNAELAANAATSSNTASALVKRDASGNFLANIITATLMGNASTATSSTSFTGSLSGDVSGTQSATIVSSVSGYSAAAVGTSVAATQAATSLNTSNTLVERDASGNFLAGTITANLVGNATNVTGTVSISNGGTGQTTQQLAINALVNAVTSGFYLRGNGTNVTMSAIQVADVPTLNQNTTGTSSNITAISNSTLITLSLLSLPTSQLTGILSIANGGTNNSSAYTAGSVLFSNGTALIQDNANLYWNDTSYSLGLGCIPATNAALDVVNSTSASKTLQLTGYGAGSTVGTRGRFARGTLGSPAAAQAGDIINFWSARAYGTSQFATTSTGVINAIAGETFTNTSNMTYLQFSTTPMGSVTSAESMRVASTGIILGPQSASTAVHQIHGGLSGITRTVTASTFTVDMTTTDYIIYTDSTSNAISITLPAPTNGRILVIEDSTGKAFTNNITINPNASEKINGLSTFIISQNYGSVRLTSDGTNWFIQALAPNVASTIQSVVPIASTVIDWSLGNMFTKTLSANTTFTFSNATAGQTLVIRLTNTASNYTVTWPSMKWPVQVTPIMTVGAFSDMYTIIYDGSNFYGSYVQNF